LDSSLVICLLAASIAFCLIKHPKQVVR